MVGDSLKVHYDPEADVLLFEVRDSPPVDAEEHDGGVIVSYGEDGDPVSVEFLGASEKGFVGADGLSIELRRDEARA